MQSSVFFCRSTCPLLHPFALRFLLAQQDSLDTPEKEHRRENLKKISLITPETASTPVRSHYDAPIARLVSVVSWNFPARGCGVELISPDCSRRRFLQSSILKLRCALDELVDGDLYFQGNESQAKSLDMLETE
jgi:hypothetical protein